MYHKEVACHFIGVGGVVIYNSKILLVKLSYGPSKGKWLIPGGMVNCGETMTEALIREIKEESNQDVIPKSIIGIRSMVRKGENLTEIYFIFNCGIQ
ncbi:NUDIX domain-containing protein [Candidatus Hodarchaeum mangrovi]